MKALFAISLGALALASISASALSAEPYGIWKVGKGKVTIKIVDCGGELCANIVGLSEPMRDGKPKVDRHNKNASLRNRPLMGLQIASGLKQVAEGKWEGKVYNADDGNTYAAKVSVIDDSVMKLKGCVLGGLICDSSKLYRQ
jgi:uncharacterized protein (DUF2147 family)